MTFSKLYMNMVVPGGQAKAISVSVTASSNSDVADSGNYSTAATLVSHTVSP